MNSLAILPDRNQHGDSSYTGAFFPDARCWVERYGGEAMQVSLALERDRQADQILTRIAVVQPEVVVFFCHGFRHKLQFAFGMGNVIKLAKAIAANATAPNVIIYACSTGNGVGSNGDGGFADTLRDELCLAGAKGCRVWGHSTAGMASQNPFVRVFRGPQPALGGEWVIKPKSDLWWAWKTYLHGPGRFEFPFLTVEQLRERLKGRGAA